MENSNGDLLFKTGIDNSTLYKDSANTKKILEDITLTANKESDKISSSYKAIGAAIGGYFTFQGAKSFANQIISVRGEMQSLETSFEVLLGSQSKANELFSEIKEYGSNTPLQLQGLASGAKTLLGFNIEAEKVMPILKQIGDISMGDEQKFQSLTLAFSQMSSAGKLMGQDLLQMINAGFNPLSVISEKTGKSIGELKEEMSQGKISSDMVAQAFADATSEGGKFYGMLEKQSLTIKGAMSNLQDSVTNMFNDIGEDSEGFIIKVVKGTESLVKNYKEVGENIMILIGLYGTYKAAIMAQIAIENTKKTVKHTQEAQELYKLLTVEQQAKISKLNLNQVSNEYYIAVQKEITANTNLEKAKLNEVKAEYKALALKKVAIKDEIEKTNELIIKKTEALNQAIASNNQQKIDIAQKQLSTLENKKENLSIELNTVSKKINTAQTKKKVATQEVEILTTKADTISQKANLTATNILTTAKLRLIGMLNKLKLALLSNPYTAVAVALAAIGAAIYKIVTYETEAEKAMKEFREESTKEEAQARMLFDALKKSEKGSTEYNEALNKIKETYPDVIKSHLDETGALKNIDAAYQDVITSIRTKIAMQAKEKAITETMSKAIENQKGLYEKFKKRLKEKGATDGEIDLITNGLSEVIKNGEEVFHYFNQLKKQYKNINFDDMGILDSSAQGYAFQIYLSESRLKKDIERIEQSFSPFINKASSGVDDITAKIKELKKELARTENNEERKKINQEIKELEEELKNPKGTGKKTNTEEEKKLEEEKKRKLEEKRKAQKDYLEEAENYNKEIIKNERDNLILFQEEKAKLEEDGIKKDLKLLDLNYQKKKNSISDKEEKMIEDLRDLKEKEAKAYGRNFNREDITFLDLSNSQKTELNSDKFIAEESYKKEYNDILDKYLQDIMTYEQKYNKIIKEGNATREGLYKEDGKTLRDGFTNENLKILDTNINKEISNLDSETANNNSDYLKWLKTISNLSEEKLKQAIEDANNELEYLENSNGKGSEKAGILREKIKKLKDSINDNNDNLSPKDGDFEKWENFNNILKDTENTFSEVSDSFSDDVKEIMNGLFNIADTSTQLISKIMNFAQTSAEAVKEGANAASKALSNMDKASVILMVIQLVIKLIRLTSELGKKMKELEVKQYYEYLETSLADLKKSLTFNFSNVDIEQINNYTEAISELIIEYGKYSQELKLASKMDFNNFGLSTNFEKTINENKEALQNSVDKLSAAYINFDYSIGKTFGYAKYDIKSTVDKYVKQIAILQVKIKEELQAKNQDLSKIEDLNSQVEDLEKQAIEIANEKINEILGGDVSSIATKLGDALVEAFQSGENAAESFGETVNDIVKDIVKNLLVSKFLEEPIAKLFDKFKAEVYRQHNRPGDVDPNNPDTLIKAVSNFKLGLDDLVRDEGGVVNGLLEALKESGYFENNSERTSKSSGIAQASQDSIDELNGRITAIQGHTFNLLENSKIIINTTAAILGRVSSIDEKASNLERLTNIEYNIKSVKDNVDTIIIKGVKTQ